MIKQLFYTVLICLLSTVVSGQKTDPTLFTVENTAVPVSEFDYIYKKTNGNKADLSEQSLQEYLDLYIKFKLKVQRAKEMQLDTIPSLQRELEGYRRQLADSYLVDKEVTEKLVKELYDRTKQDVNISHILIQLSPMAIPEDTLKVYKQLLDIKKRVEKEGFEAVAKAVSQDPTAKENGGNVGYLTAMFPNGFYAFETAAYTLPLNTVSNPIRTNIGYHLIKVNERRTAQGEIEAAHILLRTGDKIDDKAVKSRIDSLYKVLKQGGDFEALAKQYSQDKASVGRGGNIGSFGINRYEKVFENAAFGIKEDGGYSKPFQTRAGWHIIKRISRTKEKPYDTERIRLETLIKKDDRFNIANLAMIKRIQKEGNLKENKQALEVIPAALDENFLTYKWKAPKQSARPKATLFTLGDTDFTVGDFMDYMEGSSQQRIRMGRRAISNSEAVEQLYATFLDESTMRYEEKRLEKKYPEFKSLMREYEEGILLFEATKLEVWDKAAQDSTGLEEYFKTIEGRYQWQKRAVVSQYAIAASASDMSNKIMKYAQKNPANDVLSKFNTADNTILTVEEKTIEKGRNKVLDKMEWKVGETSVPEISRVDNSVNFFKIEEIIPKTYKTLAEARGYVIADYQDYLEKQWVKSLSDKYKVKINEDVLKSLVKD